MDSQTMDSYFDIDSNDEDLGTFISVTHISPDTHPDIEVVDDGVDSALEIKDGNSDEGEDSEEIAIMDSSPEDELNAFLGSQMQRIQNMENGVSNEVEMFNSCADALMTLHGHHKSNPDMSTLTQFLQQFDLLSQQANSVLNYFETFKLYFGEICTVLVSYPSPPQQINEKIQEIRTNFEGFCNNFSEFTRDWKILHNQYSTTRRWTIDDFDQLWKLYNICYQSMRDGHANLTFCLRSSVGLVGSSSPIENTAVLIDEFALLNDDDDDGFVSDDTVPLPSNEKMLLDDVQEIVNDDDDLLEVIADVPRSQIRTSNDAYEANAALRTVSTPLFNPFSGLRTPQLNFQRSLSLPMNSNVSNHGNIINYTVPMGNNDIHIPVSPLRGISLSCSIVNYSFFTIRADMTGPVQGELMDLLLSFPGTRFNWKTSTLLFPIDHYEDFVKMAHSKNMIVEAIPPEVLKSCIIQKQTALSKDTDAYEEDCENQKFLREEFHVPQSVLDNLAPFQRSAVRFVIEKKGRALVADEMGLGKTRTGIASAFCYREDWPVLIFSPSSARHHWYLEILTVIPPEIVSAEDILLVENGSQDLLNRKGQCYKIVIVSYAIYPRIRQALDAHYTFNVVLVDECHYIKNQKALRTQAIVPTIQRANRAILISGTPALSRPIELFTQLHALDPKMFANVKQFARRYCRDKKGTKKSSVFGGDRSEKYNGANHAMELHMLLTSTVMIRRLKKDILTQLPEKRRHLVRVRIEDETEREQFRTLLHSMKVFQEISRGKKSDFRPRKEEAFKLMQLFKQQKSGQSDPTVSGEISDPTIAELQRARRNAMIELFTRTGKAKLPAILKHLGYFLDHYPEKKIIVFGHHITVLDEICTFLNTRSVDFIRIDGRTSARDRHDQATQFQTSSKHRVAVLGITAAGVALTLTAAHVVFFAEFYWTPGSLIQAEDRAHRIGQQHTVRIHYFFAEDSADEILWPIVRKKMSVLGGVVEGRNDVDMGASVLANTIRVSVSASANSVSKGKSTTTEVEENSDGVFTDTIENEESEFIAKNSELLTRELPTDMEQLVEEVANEEKVLEPQKISEEEEEEEDQEDDYEEFLKKDSVPDVLAIKYMQYCQRVLERCNEPLDFNISEDKDDLSAIHPNCIAHLMLAKLRFQTKERNDRALEEKDKTTSELEKPSDGENQMDTNANQTVDEMLNVETKQKSSKPIVADTRNFSEIHEDELQLVIHDAPFSEILEEQTSDTHTVTRNLTHLALDKKSGPLVTLPAQPYRQTYPAQNPHAQYYPAQNPHTQYYPAQNPHTQYYPTQNPHTQYYPAQNPQVSRNPPSRYPLPPKPLINQDQITSLAYIQQQHTLKRPREEMIDLLEDVETERVITYSRQQHESDEVIDLLDD